MPTQNPQAKSALPKDPSTLRSKGATPSAGKWQKKRSTSAKNFDYKLHGEVSTFPIFARMDIDQYFNAHSELPYAMFPDFSALKEWANEHGMSIKQVEAKNPPSDTPKDELSYPMTDAVLVEKFYDPMDKSILEWDAFNYSSVWVRLSFENYRKAMVIYARNCGFESDRLDTLDADHVICKTRLKDHFPDCWVMLMPVPVTANRSFGSSVEKKMPKITAIPEGERGWSVEPIVMLKLFAVGSPRNRAELSHLLQQVDGQMTDGGGAFKGYHENLKKRLLNDAKVAIEKYRPYLKVPARKTKPQC